MSAIFRERPKKKYFPKPSFTPVLSRLLLLTPVRYQKQSMFLPPTLKQFCILFLLLNPSDSCCGLLSKSVVLPFFFSIIISQSQSHNKKWIKRRGEKQKQSPGESAEIARYRKRVNLWHNLLSEFSSSLKSRGKIVQHTYCCRSFLGQLLCCFLYPPCWKLLSPPNNNRRQNPALLKVHNRWVLIALAPAESLLCLIDCDCDWQKLNSIVWPLVLSHLRRQASLRQ